METENSPIPEKNMEGEAISATARKKISKEWKTAAGNHSKYQAEVDKNPNFLKELVDSILQLEKELNST